jgi:hypothetical protein
VDCGRVRERFLALPELEMARVQQRPAAFCDRVPPHARDLVLTRLARARQTDHGIRATPRMESQRLRGPYCVCAAWTKCGLVESGLG